VTTGFRPVADPIKLFFSANKEVLHFFLLSEVILLSMICFEMLKNIQTKQQKQKTKKKSFIGSASGMNSL